MKNEKKGGYQAPSGGYVYLREDFNISYPSIGEKMYGRDHTNCQVILPCEKIKEDVKQTMGF